MLWGAYGANVVHFSILQEVLAHEIGVSMGVYRQVSNNFHVYTENETVKHLFENPPYEDYDFYSKGVARALPFITDGERLADVLSDCENFCDGYRTATQFLTTVAVPLRDAYLARKRGEPWSIRGVPACDWKVAFEEWVTRRNSA
jgi:hypothetical protein